jgi:hypothetical protein
MISPTATLTASAPSATPAARDSSGNIVKELGPESDEVPHSKSLVEAQLLPWILGPLIALATVVVPLATVLGSRHHSDLPRALSAGSGGRTGDLGHERRRQVD